jgi:hypothetical protein
MACTVCGNFVVKNVSHSSGRQNIMDGIFDRIWFHGLESDRILSLQETGLLVTKHLSVVRRLG